MALKEVLAAVAPALAGALGGPLAGGVVQVLAQKLLGGGTGDTAEDERRLADLLSGGITPEIRAKLIEAEHQVKLAALAVVKQEGEDVSARWRADAASDSWLAKNVRPAVLLYILTAYTGLAVLSGADINVAPAYVELLGQWGMLVMTAYFGGRSVEKVFSILRGR